MTEPTPQSVSLPIRITYNYAAAGGDPHPANALVLFPLTNQYIELTLEQCRDVQRGFTRFLAEVDARAAGK